MDENDKPKLVLVENESQSDKKKRRPLTAKQEKFLAEMIKGSTQADAYRASYQAAGMKPSAVYNEASRLMSHPEIARRVLAHEASIERAAVSSALTRRRWVIEKLEAEAIDKDEGTSASRVRALELLGKTERLFTDVIENQPSEQSSEEVKTELERRLTELLG
jgi:hypothetical protein